MLDPEQPSDTTDTIDTPAPETPPAEGADSAPAPETPPAEPDKAQQALDALADIQRKLGTPQAASVNDVQKIREKIMEDTGWTEDQLRHQENFLANAMAPVQEQMAWMNLSTKFKDLSSVKDAMEAELKDGYHPAQRANPVVLEKVYYLVKGRQMSQQPSRPTTQPPAQRTKIAPFPGYQPSSDTNQRPSSTSLTDEEKQYARVSGISEAQYQKAKSSKFVRDLK